MSVFHSRFQKAFSKVKNEALKERIIKQFEEIRENPGIGKPMQNIRKGTREVYVAPFRLSYAYFSDEDKVVFLDLYHKDEQ